MYADKSDQVQSNNWLAYSCVSTWLGSRANNELNYT